MGEGKGEKKKTATGFGSEYRSKKAKGDMKRKGKPDPYAYIPLDAKSLNKRKAKKLQDQTRNSHWTTKTKRISPSSSRARSLKERTTGRRPLPRQSKEHVEPTTREVYPPVTSGISYDRVIIRTDARTGPTMRSRTHEQQQQQHIYSCRSFFLRVKNKNPFESKICIFSPVFFFFFFFYPPHFIFFFCGSTCGL